MKRRPNLSKVVFLASCGFLLFAYGAAVGAYQLFPFEILQFFANSFELVWAERGMVTGLRPEQHLSFAQYEGGGVTRVDRDRMQPGLTFLSGFFRDTNEMRLLDEDGRVIHRWPVKFGEIFPDASHIMPADEIPATDWNTAIHGALALPDGSVVFNFDNLGLAKVDRCGKVAWTVPRMTHHSVELSEDGTYWVPGRLWVEGESRHPPFSAPYYEDTLLEISDGGEVLQEISVLDLLFENHLQAVLLANGFFEVSPVRGPLREVVHLNDIEPLGDHFATAFPQFERGDLLLSLRDRNAVLVVDPRGGTVKWFKIGPWIRQHDPDFTENGMISVFNNNPDDRGGRLMGGSNIIAVDPLKGTSRVVYGGENGQFWFTDWRGMHEVMGNGNTLIVESVRGRVFEVDPEGNVVWEFINRYDEDEITHINDGLRYPKSYFSVEDWSCGN